MAPALLAGRVFRVAAIGVAALLFGVAAFVVAEEQCDTNGGGTLCTRSPPPVPIMGDPAGLGDAVAGPSEKAEAKTGRDKNTSTPGTRGAALMQDTPKSNTSAESKVDDVALPEVSMLKLGLALCMLFFILAWLITMLKFAVDGSLPARLALWGLLPEAYAAISVSAVYHLLRLKSGTTPCVVLRNCVTDQGALKLVQAMNEFGEKADLQALELPHNPMLTVKGLEAIIESVLRPESKVMELDFSYNPQLGDGAVKLIKRTLAMKKSKMQVLRLADIGLTQSGLQDLAGAAGRSPLKTLDLGWNSLKGCGEALASVTEAPLLEELVLTCCDLAPDDVATMAENLPYTSIRILQLGGNRFGSEGLEQLCEHLANCQVDELGLEAVGLEAGCAGLSALAMAWVQRPFSRIRLVGNRMTDEEVLSFVKTLKSMQQ